VGSRVSGGFVAQKFVNREPRHAKKEGEQLKFECAKTGDWKNITFSAQ
jgi:hypothetical protein